MGHIEFSFLPSQCAQILAFVQDNGLGREGEMVHLFNPYMIHHYKVQCLDSIETKSI